MVIHNALQFGGRRRIPWLIVVGAAACASGCIRSVDVPEQLEGVTITGQVVIRDAATGDWTGTDGVAVRVRGSAFGALTADGGLFKLDRLPIGVPLSLELEAPPPTEGPERQRILDPVRGLVDGQAINLGVVQLGPTGGVAGRVQVRADPTVEPRAAEGAIVVAVGTAFRAISGAQGGFDMSGLPEGAFDITAYLSGHRPARLEGVRVAPGSTTNLEDIVLVPGETPTVTVDARALRAELAGEAVGHAGITVTFYEEQNVPEPTVAGRATTGEDGGYTLDVPVGVYRVTVTGNELRALTLTGVAVLPEGVLGLPTVYLAALTPGDNDGDGVPDEEDDDDDNDGCVDDVDAFPTDSAHCFDNDGDGIADGIDPDDDNDGLTDAEEITEGLDGWRTNPREADTDGDDVNDKDDVCPTEHNPAQVDSDGDGIGDLCQPVDVENPNVRPLITSISPLEGGTGTILRIEGRGFQSAEYPTRVQFGLPLESGALVEPITVQSNLLEVRVPENALTGRLRVYAGGYSTTSSATFTYRNSPTVEALSPASGRRGSRVRVLGQNLDFGNLAAYVNGEPAQIIPHPTEGEVRTVYVGQTRYDALDVAVPEDATTGPILIEHDFGVGQSAADFVVEDAGVVVTSILPGTAPAGTVLRIRGYGFSTDDLVAPDPVQVIFHNEFPVVQDILPGSTDTQLLVEVPTDARTGPVRITHPASATEVQAGTFFLDEQLPILTGASDYALLEGDTIQLLGANLNGASSVTFTGGAQVTNLAASSGVVELDVPAGVQPGPVTVQTPSGAAESLFDMYVLEYAPDEVQLIYAAIQGGGFGPPQGTTPPSFFTLDQTKHSLEITTSSTGLTLVDRTDRSSLFDAGQQASYFFASPDGRYAVVFTNPPGAKVFELPSFTPVASCPDAPYSPHVAFDDARGQAFYTVRGATTSFVRVIDFVNGTCDTTIDLEVDRLTTGDPVALMRPNGQLLVVAYGAGQALFDVDPTSPLFGSRIDGWTPPATVSPFSLVEGLAGEVFVGEGVGPWRAFVPMTGIAPAPVSGDTLSPRTQILDGVGRFVWGFGVSNNQIIDTSVPGGRGVRSIDFPAGGSFGAGIPGKTGWVVSAINSTYLLRRLDIRTP